jgi:hypothetical protein
MTIPNGDIPVDRTTSAPKLGRNDPLLQELWAAKAALNAAENFQVNRLAAKAASFDIDAVLKQLAEKVRH